MKPVLLAMLACSTPLFGQDFYIATTGTDAGPGTVDAPFRTIQQAAQVAQPGDSVIIRAGTYRETVTPPRSGTEHARIIYKNAPDEIVAINGTEPLSSWTKRADGKWEAPMPSDFFASYMNQANQLFLDDTMIHEARWPNIGPSLSHPDKATIDRFISKEKSGNVTTVVFEDDAIAEELVGSSIHIQPNAAGWGWTLSGKIVKQEGKRITFTTFNDCGEDSKQWQYAVGSRYHVWGLAQFIDDAWEWHHDRHRNVVIINTPKNEDPNKRTITAKKRDLGVDLTDTSWVTVQGIHLFACNLTSDTFAGGNSIGYTEDGSVLYPWAANGRMATASHLIIDGIDGQYLNHFTDVSGHFFLQWSHNTGLVLAGSDNVITNCTVKHTAGNGISLQGKRARCQGNTILDSNYTSTDCAGISTGVQSVAEDFDISYNHIERTARTGITIRGLINSDPNNLIARVHHNAVINFGCQDWDTGAFYMAGQDGKFTRIDHNHFYCTEPREGMVFGMYWDYSKNYIADHNVIWGVPTPIQVTRSFGNSTDGPTNLIICNNTAIPNDAPWGRPFYADEGIGNQVFHNVMKVADFKQDDGNWGNHWPKYGDQSKNLENLIFGARAGTYWNKEKCLDPNDLYSDTITFSNPAKHDFRITTGAPKAPLTKAPESFTLDGVTIPLSGISTPSYVGALPPKQPSFTVGPQALPQR